VNTNGWRISTVNGTLLAAYFVPAWTIVAFKIMVSPVHGLFDRPNISVALFVSDYLHLGALTTVRFAWLLAIGKLTVAAFLAAFIGFVTQPKTRSSGDCEEVLWVGLGIGSLFSFASMVMASRVGEHAAMQLHAAELMLMLGGLIIMAADRPVTPAVPEQQPVRYQPMQAAE
jgi:hypothetical protein